jgi:hypothetical protein
VRDSQLLDAPREFWDKVLVAIESCEPPSSLAEFRSQPSAEGGSDSEIITTKLDECIRKLKWQRLLRNHAAQCLVSRLLPKPLSIKPRRLSTFLFERATNLQELNSKLNEVAQIPQGLSVSILGAADLRLDSIYVGKTLKKMEERLICEVREIGHTLPVFLSLAHAAGKTGLLASDAPYFLANHEPTATARETRDWPIQSEAYHDSSCEHHIDCGTETAFSIPAIWRAWCAELEEKAPELESLGCLDHIHLQTIDASGIRVSLSSSKADNRETMLEFLLVDNTTPRVDFQRVLAHDADLLRDHLETSPVPECELDQTKSNTLTRKVFPEPCSAASRVMAVIARCRENRVRSANQSGSSEQDSSFCVLLAYVGGQPRLEHRILSTNQHIRVPATKEEVAAFEQIASSRHERDILLGKNFGFTTHIFVPISRPSEDASAGRAEQDVGFAVFSSSQVEHDTIRRVEIRPAQQALVTFATDYLEYAISQELQTVDMQESLQEFAHSLRRRGRFMRYGSLAAYTESILPQIARDNGFGDTAALLSSLVNRQAPAALVQHLDNLVRAVGKLSYLKEANADFNVLVNALTFVLANKSEPPLGVGDIDRTSSLDSLENWFNHIATEAKAAEEQRHGSSNCAILIENNLTGTTAITNAPLGSWAIMLEEVIRNAAKHGKPHSVRELTLSINSREITVRCTNEVTTDGSKTDSTLAGFRAIRRLLRVNYGELGKGWNLIRTDESGHFSLLINAKHEFYNRLHSRI